MQDKLDLVELLSYIDPTSLDYTEWVNVGMALKHEGYTVSAWDRWSGQDTRRYRHGECEKKWNGFHGTGTPVTAGTIVQLAKDNGWRYERDEGHELGWDDEIRDDLVVIDKNWVEGTEVHDPTAWSPAKELTRYLETLFEASENVGYVVSTWEKEGKFLPTKGNWDRTAGDLIQRLNNCGDDLGSVLGDYNPLAGAWIRFNPMDGKGCKNENVTEFRYALVESDTMELDKQNAILRQLELPIACLVHSGNKSLHAIVKVDAANYDEYRKRVDYLYKVCQKNGLKIDSQNRNPSRLSRMPGIVRGENKQFIVDTNIGKPNWNEWFEWIEGVNDDLPDPESLTDIWDNLPQLSPPLIHGLLRQGHKMLMAGPSKAGKSYALIQLCIAIAEGKRWFGWNCAQGRILYVNLELDRASCLHRFRDVYQTLGYDAANIDNIDIWNLRGKSVPMDKLAPKLIRRAHKKEYVAIVIDPIYKVITGDENSADQMAHFCNQFDRVCTDLEAAVIYCHHHSKGYQGGKKSMDRASGSGVFARDPDALIDLVELDLTEDILIHESNKAEAGAITDVIRKYNRPYYDDEVSQDDLCSAPQMRIHAKTALNGAQMREMAEAVIASKERVKAASAWRVEGTLREFPKFDPLNLWFRYPVHVVDNAGILGDVEPESEKPAWAKAAEKRKPKEQKAEERSNALEIAFSALEMDESEVSIEDISEEMGVTKRTVWNRIREHGGFETYKSDSGKESFIRRKPEKDAGK